MRLKHLALTLATAFSVGATAGATRTAEWLTGVHPYGAQYVTGLVALGTLRVDAPRLALATTAAAAAAIVLAERGRPNGAAPGHPRSRWLLSLVVAPMYALVCFGSLCGITGAGMLWDLSSPGSELVTVGLVWITSLGCATAMEAVLVPLFAALPHAELLGFARGVP